MSSQKEDRERDTEEGSSGGFGWVGLGVATLFGGLIGAGLTFLSVRSSQEPQCNASDGMNNERQENFRNRPLTCERCVVCLDDVKVVITLPCGHRFHADCVEVWVRENGTCPSCRTKLTPDQMKYSA